MAVLSVFSSLLIYLMLMARYYCAPNSFGISGTFGAESHLNVTGRGYGTLKQDSKGVSGDADGFIGAKWNSTVYSGGVANYNGIYVGATGSVNKVVEGALKPSATFQADLDGTNITARLSQNKESSTVYKSQILIGDDAKRLDRFYRGDVNVNSVNGKPSLSNVYVMFYTVIVIKSIN